MQLRSQAHFFPQSVLLLVSASLIYHIYNPLDKPVDKLKPGVSGPDSALANPAQVIRTIGLGSA